ERGEIWSPIVPVPESAPPFSAYHVNTFRPPNHKHAETWPYYVNGALHSYVVRYDHETNPEEKTFRPFTFCTSTSEIEQRREWRRMAPPQPWPLYGVDNIA